MLLSIITDSWKLKSLILNSTQTKTKGQEGTGIQWYLAWIFNDLLHFEVFAPLSEVGMNAKKLEWRDLSASTGGVPRIMC